MKRLVFSLVAMFAMATVVGGAFAAFTDNATAGENVFQAGTLDLELSQDGSTWTENTTGVWVSPVTLAPGETFTDTLWLRDAGSIDIQTLEWDMSSYTQAPDTSQDMGLVVNLTGAWYDRNGNNVNDGGAENVLPDLVTAYAGGGTLTLRELHDGMLVTPFNMEVGAEVLPGSVTSPTLGGATGTGKRLELTWEFDATAGNEYQGRSVEVDFDFAASNI